MTGEGEMLDKPGDGEAPRLEHIALHPQPGASHWVILIKHAITESHCLLPACQSALYGPSGDLTSSVLQADSHSPGSKAKSALQPPVLGSPPQPLSPILPPLCSLPGAPPHPHS